MIHVMICHARIKKRCFKYTQFFFLLITGLTSFKSFSQQTEIPIGTWRLHLSYNKIISIAVADKNIYGASEMGILVFNRSEKSLTTYNKLSGLTSSGISFIAYDQDNSQLIITYEDGNIDIVKDNTVSNFSRLKDLNTITGSKRINHILIKDNLAYLSTDYGIVVFDLKEKEVKETWRDLGINGTNIKINQSVIFQNSIVATTEKGLIIGSLNDNLLDYNKWKRFDTGDFLNPVKAVTTFNEKIYVAIDGKGIYRYESETFIKEDFLQGNYFLSIDGTVKNLLIVTTDKLWLLNTSNQIVQVADDEITRPLMAREDEQEVIWIADENNGLISNVDGGFQNYLPNGPDAASAFRLRYFDNKIYAVPGGYTDSGAPLGKTKEVNYFENGFWNVKPPGLKDITDVAHFSNKIFTSSFGSGLLQEEEGNSVLYDDTNSPLEKFTSPKQGVYISSMETSGAGLWIVNYGSDKTLHLLKTDNEWQSYSLNFSVAKFPLNMVVDQSENVWLAINPSEGGGLVVFNSADSQTKLLTDVAGGGGLPNKFVRSLAVDREDNVWVGTNSGVAYFFSKSDDAIKPIFENRFLLKDEKITAIEIDGGNRKWIGTERGVWLFNPSGDILIQNFTSENSPLLSNVIQDIEINKETGEVFFSTDKGVVSYRGDATVSDGISNAIKIFPNPVTADFSGMVGISGLIPDSYVKITDVSGKLIWQTQANGGTATWNVRDYNGKHARTGVYLVFSTAPKGSESMVGKIAVIE